MNNEVYITLKGGRKVIVANTSVEWTDRHGHHCGRVVDYRKTREQGGSPVTYQKMVFVVDCGDDGIRELRPNEMRDIIEKTNH